MYRITVLMLMLSLVTADNIPAGFDQNVCKIPPNNGGRSFPTIPDNFVAHIELNDHVARRSMYMSEYVSGMNNIATGFITGLLAPGITSQYITSADTGELFTIKDIKPGEFQDGNCEVKPLSADDKFAFPFKHDPRFPNSDQILSGKSILNIGASPVGNMLYNGTGVFNGISCDIWTGCLWIPEGKTTIAVTYYFSRNDTDAEWFNAGGYSSAIVGVQAKGKSATDQSLLEQTFNYAYFSTQWPSLNLGFFTHVFETPEHAYCPGRKNVLQLPKVPTHFGFRAEVIDNVAQTITFTREWYDFEGNYTRMDFKNAPTGNNSVDAAVRPSSIINDFNTGVSYITNMYTKECVAIPILGGEFDSVAVTPDKTRMRTPKEFFDFDNTDKYPYQFMGVHLVRNVQCNSWISYRPFPNEQSPFNATWEWYFATNLTIIKSQDLVEDLEPMRVAIKSNELNVDIVYNFYRFSEHKPDNKLFDVSACYIDSESISYDMQFTGNWTQGGVENQLQLLRYWFTLSVQAYTGLESIRVQDIEFEFYEDKMAVKLTILGPAPIKGDVDGSITQVSLQEASDRFTKAFETGVFEIFFEAAPGTGTIVFTPVADSLRVITRKEDSGAYRPISAPIQNSTNVQIGPGLSSGAAAGLAFGMMFAGIVLAGVAILVMRKYTTNAPSTSYSRHRDDE